MKARYKYAETSARRLLDDLKMTSPPIKLYPIAEKIGLRIVPYDAFPDSVSALLLKNDSGTIIGVNSNQSTNRQRFSIAHEIGHYILAHYKRDAYLDMATDIAEGVPLDHSGIKDAEEKEANCFASELLMPTNMIRKDFAQMEEPSRLAKRYEVSEEAVWVKLLRLNLVTG